MIGGFRRKFILVSLPGRATDKVFASRAAARLLIMMAASAASKRHPEPGLSPAGSCVSAAIRVKNFSLNMHSRFGKSMLRDSG